MNDSDGLTGREKMSDKCVPTKMINQCLISMKVADEFLWLFHCTMVADNLFTDKTKMINQVIQKDQQLLTNKVFDN